MKRMTKPIIIILCLMLLIPQAMAVCPAILSTKTTYTGRQTGQVYTLSYSGSALAKQITSLTCRSMWNSGVFITAPPRITSAVCPPSRA